MEETEQDELRNEEIQPIEIRMTGPETLRQYPLSIDFLHRGCIIRIGCKHIAFESPNDAIKEIQEYIADPIGMKKKWEDVLK
jgi:hypothetical protein